MELIDIGKTPISPQAPAGQDTRLSPLMDTLNTEIDKMSSVTSFGSLDWQKVAELSANILKDESKDLLVCCYLCFALLQTKKISGFGTGIHILRDLLENFWETMFPAKKRMRGRLNAIQWWLEKSIDFIDGGGLEPVPAEEIDTICNDIKAVDEFLSEKTTDSPSIMRLQQKLNSLRKQTVEESLLPKQDQNLKQAQPASMPSKPENNISTETSGSIKSDEDSQKVLKEALKNMKEASSYLIEQNLFNPLIYRINRTAAWLTVTKLPPTIDRKTKIPPPARHVIMSLKTLYQNEDWQNLLKTAESHVCEYLFWTDLSFWVTEALDKLGHKNIADIVCIETVNYVSRIKGIEFMEFSDGTPFADNDTRKWLKTISSGQGDTSLSLLGGLSGSTESDIAQTFSKATELAHAKKLTDAVSLLYEKLKNSSSGSLKFSWRIALAKLLLDAGEEKAALPHLTSILSDIDNYTLERWDPDLAIRALMVIYSGFSAQKDNDLKSKAQEIFYRISALNPAIALSVD